MPQSITGTATVTVSTVSSYATRTKLHPILEYTAALLLTGLCSLLVAWLFNAVGSVDGGVYRPYTILYVGTLALIVYTFGVGPGLASLAAALLITYRYFTVPPGPGMVGLAGVRVRDLIEMTGMVVAGGLMIWGAEFHRQQRDRLEQALARVEIMRGNEERMLADVLRSVTQGKLLLYPTIPALPDLARVLHTVTLQRPKDLSAIRSAVRAAATQAGLDSERLTNFLTAAHEAAMNAVVHGAGGMARVGFTDKDECVLAVHISDNGPGIALEKLPERALYSGISGANSLGMGFSLVLDGVDRMHLRTGSEGTDVLLEIERTPPPPAWFNRLLNN